MKQKFYLTSNGAEVEIGSTIVSMNVEKTSSGEIEFTKFTLITPKNVAALIEAGILTDEKPEESDNPLYPFVEKVARRMGWKTKKVENILNLVDQMYPASAFSIVLKEIAIELDKKYTDHISKSPELWTISLLDGKPAKISKKGIKSFQHFAAFRSLEDALKAVSICKPLLTSMFGE